MVPGSVPNTVKILRLSPKRPLCAMQAKLTQQGSTRLRQKSANARLRSPCEGCGFRRRGAAKCYSLQE
jgi:hypothetical protein